MSTMGINVYCNRSENGSSEQLMLLRTLQDNERNIISGVNNNNNNNNRTTTNILPKNNVSVIAENERGIRRQPQQQQQQQQQATAVLPPYDPSRLKKHGKNGQPPPIAVAKRNARERNRVKQVNNGFATLRQHIPGHVAQGYGDRGKKLSKVETLRMAVEYIRGLQRLLAEADGLDYDAISSSGQNQMNDSSIMIPSPTGSVYSSSTHNGSGDVLCLAGSELDEQHSAGCDTTVGIDEDVDAESYLMDDEDDEDEMKDRRESKRFRVDDRSSQNRLSENQNRDRIVLGSAPRRRRNSPTTTYYVTKQASSFGDEENIEPLMNRNNNNNNNNNNNLLATFSPILLQTSSPTNGSLPPIKREIRLMDEDEGQRSHDEESSNGVILTSAAPYTGEIYIESPETGRLVPLKLEDDEMTANTQLVYVSTSAEGLPTTTYYKHDIADGGTEFMDVVSWWEQEQGRLVHQLQGHHHHHHHHHHAVQHQQTTHQQHQQITTAQQRLAHV